MQVSIDKDVLANLISTAMSWVEFMQDDPSTDPRVLKWAKKNIAQGTKVLNQAVTQ